MPSSKLRQPLSLGGEHLIKHLLDLLQGADGGCDRISLASLAAQVRGKGAGVVDEQRLRTELFHVAQNMLRAETCRKASLRKKPQFADMSSTYLKKVLAAGLAKLTAI